MVKIFVVRFVKIMLTTTLAGVLGIALLIGILFYLSPGVKLRGDLNYEADIMPAAKAVGAWFGMVFFIGFISVVSGLPKTFSVPFQDRETFLERLKAAIKSVRYRPLSQDEDRLVFKPPLIGGPLAEKIYVGLAQNVATISAPRGLVKKLEKQLL